MPFAHDGRTVAGLPEHFGQGDQAGIDQQGRVAGQDFGVVVAPGVDARQQAVAARRAGSRGGVAVGKAHAAVGQVIDIRGFEGRLPVGAHIAVAQVVEVDDEDVGECPTGLALIRAGTTSLTFGTGVKREAYQGGQHTEEVPTHGEWVDAWIQNNSLSD